MEVKAGERYLGITCGVCRRPVPLFHLQGGKDVDVKGPGLLGVTCSHCGADGKYLTEQVERFLAERTH